MSALAGAALDASDVSVLPISDAYPVGTSTHTTGAFVGQYKLNQKLGEGQSSSVWAATKDGTDFAVKILHGAAAPSPGPVMHELAIWRLLGEHPHIVSLIEYFHLNSSWHIVMRHSGGCDALQVLCEGGAFTEARAASVTYQCASALAHMHSLSIVHRDVKLENIVHTAPGAEPGHPLSPPTFPLTAPARDLTYVCQLLSEAGDAQIADFGLAVRFGGSHPPLTALCGTAAYVAPEILAAAEEDGAPYGVAVDLFALGGVLFAVLGTYAAFDPRGDLTDEEILERVRKGQWAFDAFERWDSVSGAAKRLIAELLEPEPAKRRTANEVLECPWARGEGVGDEGGPVECPNPSPHTPTPEITQPQVEMLGGKTKRSRARELDLCWGSGWGM